MATNFRVNGIDTDQLFVEKNIFTEGGLWAWGNGQAGNLGVFGDTTWRSSPVQTSTGGSNWIQVANVNTFAGAGIKSDGTLWIWGTNTDGGLGINVDPSVVSSSTSPVQIPGTNWKQVAQMGSSGNHAAAIKTDGTLWLWGNNTAGRLGDNTVVHRSSPVQTVSGGTNWKQVSCGGIFTGAIKTDGTLWMWGTNTFGYLGNGAASKSSPTQTVAAGTNWKQISCGLNASAAIKTDGTLWTWGGGNAGMLGNGDTNAVSSPVQTVSAGTNWKQVSFGHLHVGATKTDGTLWMWGHNQNGALGDNTVVHRSSPVQTVSGGTNWKQVACGFYYTAAIKTDGTLWVWGQNDKGNLGVNDIVHRSSPVQTLPGGTNWKTVSAGYQATFSVSTDFF